MNSLSNYIGSCRLGTRGAYNNTALNYQKLIALADTIVDQSNDCVDVITLAASEFAGEFCSDTFDQARLPSSEPGK